MPKLLLKKALVIDPERRTEQQLDILIADGKIALLARNIPPICGPGCGTIDASGLWLMPGIIDMHVHTREPGNARAETMFSAAKAAAAGGVTSILAMPNTEPPLDKPRIIEQLRDKAQKAAVNVYFSGAATRGRGGKALTDFRKLKKAGAAAFTDDGACIADPDIFEQALKLAKRLNMPLLDHAEYFPLTGNGVVHACRKPGLKTLPLIPREAETFMILRDVLTAGKAGASVHLQHLSCRESVDIVRWAKKAGIDVTAETCPHYFALTCQDVAGPNHKMKPPLREPSDVQAIKAGLADGTIDVIASDHAPHTAAAKAAGMLRAPFGIIGLETMLGLAMTELFHTDIISKVRLAQLLSLAPARILHLNNKGSLKPGMDADLTLIDPYHSCVVTRNFRSKSANSPFIGKKLKGRAAATIVAGRLAYIHEDLRKLCRI